MEKLSKKLLASTCLFCANSSTSVRKFKITEDYGGGNTIRYDLTSFLGHQIEPYLKDEDLLCSNCMNFFENMAYTKRRLIDFLRNRDESEDIKMQGFNDIWKGFKKFAVNLVKFNPNESEETWDSPEVHSRSITPNPLVHTYSEPYNQAYERQFSELERVRSKSVTGFSEVNSETDLEVRQLFSRRGRRKKRGHNWTRRRGEQKSRALSRTYPAIYDSYDRNCYSSLTRVSSTSLKSSNPPRSRNSRRKKIVEGKPVKTRSVSRLENYLATVTAEKESNKFYCEEMNCPLFFERLENFVLHKRHDHNIIARFPCQQCHFKGTTRKELELHYNKMHDKETILCSQCRAEIQGTQNLQEHLKKHQEYSIGCKFCYLNFLSKTDLVEHVSIEHQGRQRKKVRQKSSAVCEVFVNREKTSVECSNNNNPSVVEKSFKSIVLNVEKSPVPLTIQPLIPKNSSPIYVEESPITISDKSPSISVISDFCVPDHSLKNIMVVSDEVDNEIAMDIIPSEPTIPLEFENPLKNSTEEQCSQSATSITDVFAEDPLNSMSSDSESESTISKPLNNYLSECDLQSTHITPIVVLERMNF